MIDEATATYPAADERSQRYRQAERTLWAHHGLEPTERFIELDAPAVRLRVLEVGSGEPVLFIHGTGGPGSLPSLVSELSGFRCLMLDRPGWGLSSSIDYAQHDYKTVADLLSRALDGLGVDQAHVIGASIGNNWALRLAQRQPSRVGRIVLLGGSPLVPEIQVPGFIRLLSSPIGAVIVRVPLKPKLVQGQLRQLGHGPSLDAGRIPDAFIECRLALHRETDSMRSERDMVRAAHASGHPKRPHSRLATDESQSSRRTLTSRLLCPAMRTSGGRGSWRLDLVPSRRVRRSGGAARSSRAAR
jgi:pimeloyl-ACP methyl ester carboxylesterase